MEIKRPVTGPPLQARWLCYPYQFSPVLLCKDCGVRGGYSVVKNCNLLLVPGSSLYTVGNKGRQWARKLIGREKVEGIAS